MAGVDSVAVTAAAFSVDVVTVDVNITHPDRGELEVDLTSPLGTVVRLHNRTGAGLPNLIRTYNVLIPPDGPGALEDFDGEPMAGMWTLNVADRSNGNSGTLESWTLHLTAPLTTVCAPVPCYAFPQASATPPAICGGDSATLSAAGSFVSGDDCSGIVEHRFEEGAVVLQDWSADADIVVAPATSASYTVRVRDQGTGADDSVAVPVTVETPPTNSISQLPSPLPAGQTLLVLNAGPGPATYTWRDDAMAVVGTEQFLELDTNACGRDYSVEMATLAGCSATAFHTVLCIPPEVSSSQSPVPLRMGLDGAGTLEVELLQQPGVTYHLYHAATLAEMLAGDWTSKICDLASGSTGTWNPLASNRARWTPLSPDDLYEGYWVVVAELSGLEGSYGLESSGLPRPPDLDAAGSTHNAGCP
jgi:subtilisin-like proprotein convertase family protein